MQEKPQLRLLRNRKLAQEKINILLQQFACNSKKGRACHICSILALNQMLWDRSSRISAAPARYANLRQGLSVPFFPLRETRPHV
jgi:hypothetical protein